MSKALKISIFFSLATVISILFLDNFIFNEIQKLPKWTIKAGKYFSFFISPGFNAIFWGSLLAASIFLKDKFSKKYILLFFTITISVIISFAACKILKLFFARLRPEHLKPFGFMNYSKLRNDSFPSSHAATIATILICFIKKEKWLIPVIILSMIISLSRLLAHDHYLSDILMGISTGVTSALYTKKGLSFMTKKIEQASKLARKKIK